MNSTQWFEGPTLKSNNTRCSDLMTQLDLLALGQQLPGTLSRTGYTPPADLQLADWIRIGEILQHEGQSATKKLSTLLWLYADWLRYGECRYGEEHGQALDPSMERFSLATISQIRWVGRIPPSNRLDGLPFWHHMEVVSLVPAKGSAEEIAQAEAVQRSFLEKARDEGWSRRELATQVREYRSQKRWEETKVQPDRYQVVWADPPWRRNGDTGLSGEKIVSRAPPVARDAVLLLWADSVRLRESLNVIVKWGFAYRTHLVWQRDIGVIEDGEWFVNRHRLLLIGLRGDAPDPQPTLPSIFTSKGEVECWVRENWDGNFLDAFAEEESQ